MIRTILAGGLFPANRQSLTTRVSCLMIKALAFLLVYLLLGFGAAAEGEPYDFQDEWYVFNFYPNKCLQAQATDEGGFSFGDDMSKSIVHPDGLIEENGTTEQATMLSLPNNGPGELSLVYRVRDSKLARLDDLEGLLFIQNDGQCLAYPVEGLYLLLMIDGKFLSFDGAYSGEYYQIDDRLFLVKDNKYTRGYIESNSTDTFMYFLDEEPYTLQYGDIEFNYGKPVQLFIRASLMKAFWVTDTQR